MNIKITAVKRGREVEFYNDTLRKNWKKCETIQNKLKRFHDMDSYSFYYIATERNITVGYLYAYMISQSGQLTYHSTAKLEMIIVAEQYQNQGIATALLEVFSEFCYNHNIKILETEAFRQNEYMRRLYWSLNLYRYCYKMRMGFKEEQV